jgi:polyphosphate kinase 2 (PPK2 family)
MVFEGWDAAGKGGAIKRLTEKLDPRGYVVYPIKAPEGDERVRHYLWRFWRTLPEAGQIAILDRSWYGRVLVERVEGFAPAADWQRAYSEINQFERQLTDFGTIVFKFWLHVSPEEQLKRFQDRAGTPHKAWKLTDEDWRNRDKWGVYERAVEDMVIKTSTPHAPWTLVSAVDKYNARLTVLETVVKKLSASLN